MKHFLSLLLIFFFSFSFAQQKPRILVLTDIENEPDDAMSLVRYLLYANQFDTEGLVATTSIHQPDQIADWRIIEILEAYGKVQSNLIQHEPGYPTEPELQSVVFKGIPTFGLNGVGDDKDSGGSERIIECLQKQDDRPLWVLVWGGPNVLAQALYKIDKTMEAPEKEKLLKKLRVYTISDQDDSGPWIRKHFPEVFYIVSPGTWAGKRDGYFYSTWAGISGERHYNFATGADTSLVSNTWVDQNIQNGKSALGNQYPDIEYIMEGDSPSFMFLINNGLNEPEKPEYGGWGGRYELYQPKTQKWFWEEETRPIYTNAIDKVLGIDGRYYADNRATIWRWREHYQNDFATRMTWTYLNFKEANHPPVAIVNEGLRHSLRPGENLKLSAAKSIDPDGDKLHFHWYVYAEAGLTSISPKLSINGPEVTFEAPDVNTPQNYHVILEVSDDRTPALTRYQRVIIAVNP